MSPWPYGKPNQHTIPQEIPQTLEEQVQQLRAEVAQLRDALEPAIQVWADLQGVARTLKRVGTVLKFILGIVAPIIAIWAALHGKPTGR